MLNRLRFLFNVTRQQGIARRYFVTNGFDGALTMLGLTMGFYISDEVSLSVIISACLGAAIALCMSGLTSAFISETAEKKKELYELEQAMLTDLGDSQQATGVHFIPLLVAAVNGFAPLLISLFIIAPLWLSNHVEGLSLPMPALEMAIGSSFLCIFGLGAFLGRISGVFWLWSAFKTTFIGVITVFLILYFK